MAAQIAAVCIFIVMFFLIITERFPRQYVTTVCGILTLVVVFGLCMHSAEAIWKVLNVESIFHVGFWYAPGTAEESATGINWSTILFIAGMMVMVEGMARAGFFRWLCMRLAMLVHYKPVPLFLAFMAMSAFLAMFIDSITVILFLAAVTVELGKLLRFDPIPMILSEIFCANLGGSATMCGDPPNIIIGTALGYSFGDFLFNTGLMAGISLILVMVYFYLAFRKQLSAVQITEEDIAALPDPKDVVTSKQEFVISTMIFACAVLMLVTHAQTGLTVAFIGVFIAVVSLIAAGTDAPLVLRRLDHPTLVFFIGLFVVVGGLEETGILESIAGLIGALSGGNVRLMIAIIIWLSAFASAIVDNIPFAATMIPIIKSLAASQGIPLSTLAWALAMGTDVGGSATPVGASANVVGVSVAAKNGHMIGWGKYCKTAIPATVIVIAVSMLMIFVRYC